MDLDAKTIEQLGQRVHDARTFLHIDDKSAELAALDEETAQPGFWDNVTHAQAVSKRAGNLREAIREYDDAVSLFDDAQTAFELADEDEAFAAEASDACEKLAKLLDSLELSSAKRRLMVVRGQLHAGSSLDDASLKALFEEATSLQRRINELNELISRA